LTARGNYTAQERHFFWDVLALLLIGMTVSMAVLSVGPLIAFGFLLIPALSAHMVARKHAPVYSDGLFDRWLSRFPRFLHRI